MRILEVTHRYPPNVGGVEQHVSKLSAQLRFRGHDVEILTYDGGTREPTWDWKYVTRRWSLAPGGNFHLTPRAATDALFSDADVIHVHNYHSFPAVLSSLGSIRTPVVFTPHYHGASASGLRNLLLKAYHPLGRLGVRNAQEVIAVSEWSQGKIQDDFQMMPTVIPHGLDYDPFQREYDRPVENRYALVVGRLEDYKNVDAAIKAMAYLSGLELVIVGDGPALDDLKEMAGGQCRFVGKATDSELHSWYSHADVFLNLSEFEAFGMTVGEALASGTPVVLYPERGLERWKGTDGVEVSYSLKPREVAGAILRAIMTDVDREPLPSWSEVAERTESVLESASR